MKIVFESISNDLEITPAEFTEPSDEVIELSQEETTGIANPEDLTVEDVHELETSIESFLDKQNSDFSEDTRVLDTSSNLLELAEKINNEQQDISLESLELIGKMATTGTGLDHRVFIGIENLTEKKQ